MMDTIFSGEYEYRMYFFVPYNISDIQKGIQAGHAALRYAKKYGDSEEENPIWEFIENHETWIILNGGTTNNTLVDNVPTGSLDKILVELIENEIDYAKFNEPDLNNALTAVCFLADERVWNFKKYPDWKENTSRLISNLDGDTYSVEEINENGLTYSTWKRKMGEKNVVLRNLIRGKKLA